MVKMRSVMWVAASVAMFGLAGCASAPVSYHTLQGSSEAGSGTSAQPDLRYQIAAVNVPERLNRPDLVLSGTPETAGKPGGADAGGGQVRADTSVTALIEGSTVMAMRTVRPREAVRAAVSWLEARSSIHDFVKALGTASRIVPSMSPRGRADRSMDVAAGPSSLVGTVSSASAHALVMVSVATLSSRASRL